MKTQGDISSSLDVPKETQGNNTLACNRALLLLDASWTAPLSEADSDELTLHLANCPACQDLFLALQEAELAQSPAVL